MEALMVFDPNNYPVLSKVNKQFMDAISGIVLKHKIIEAPSKEAVKRILLESDEEFKNVLILIFVPCIASLRILKNRSPMGNLLSENHRNAKISFSEHLDHFFLYVNDINSFRSIKQAEKRLNFFKEITKFVFGSNPGSAKSDAHQTSLLKAMYETWISSRISPVYLVEATELLLLSPNIQSMFTRLLQYVLSNSRDFLANFNEHPNYCLMFMHRKLVSQYSCRNAIRLSKKNMILITLLVEAINSLSDYQSETTENLLFSDAEEEEAMEYFGDNDDSDREDERVSSPSSTRSHKKSSFSNESPVKICLDDLPCQSHIVFLAKGESSDILHPFCARVFSISSSLRLVLLSELRSSELAASIHTILDFLNCVQYNKSELNGFVSLHKMERSFQKLKLNLKEKNCRPVMKLLERLLKSDLRKICLELEERSELPAVVEALCSSICASLREIYHNHVYLKELYRLECDADSKVLTAFWDSLRIYCEQRVADYVDYLEVKSERNMTVEPYLSIVPELVAFIYVDRAKNELVTAVCDDLNGAVADNNLSYSNLRRNVMPSAVEQAYNSLAAGNLSTRWTSGELAFNFYLWFEDLSGHPLQPNVTDFTLATNPSLVANNFVQEIIAKCFTSDKLVRERKAIACYEILYIQRMSQPMAAKETLMQAKRLAAKLWEVTAAASRSADGMWTLV